jgi:hypothetical protein
MDVVAAIVAVAKSAKSMEPCNSSYEDPAPSAESDAVTVNARRDEVENAVTPQRLAMCDGVVGTVREECNLPEKTKSEPTATNSPTATSGPPNANATAR